MTEHHILRTGIPREEHPFNAFRTLEGRTLKRVEFDDTTLILAFEGGKAFEVQRLENGALVLFLSEVQFGDDGSVATAGLPKEKQDGEHEDE